MQTLTRRSAQTQGLPLTYIPLDVLVMHARELIGEQDRLVLFERLHRLASAFKRPGQRGPWLLVFAQNAQERALGSILTRALTTRCFPFQGVRVVNEGTSDQTARAALDLHRLHFSHLPEQQRGAHILILGGNRESQLLRQIC